MLYKYYEGSTRGANSTFLHAFPWQCPHAEMHFTLFFLQEHRFVEQSPLQLQLMNFTSLSGAIAPVMAIGS